MAYDGNSETLEVVLNPVSPQKWQFGQHEIAPSGVIALVRSFLTEWSPVDTVSRFSKRSRSIWLHCRDQRKVERVVFNFLL